MNITFTNTLRKINDKIVLHSEKQPSAEEVRFDEGWWSKIMNKDDDQGCCEQRG